MKPDNLRKLPPKKWNICKTLIHCPRGSSSLVNAGS